MSMPMKPEELRQLRAWAVEITVGKYATEMAHDKRQSMPLPQVIVAEARTLVNFIRSSTGT